MNAPLRHVRPAPINLRAHVDRLRGRVFAQGSEVPDLAALSRQFAGYHAETTKIATSVAELGKEIDKMNARIAGLTTINGISGGGRQAPDPVYGLVGDYMRRGGNSDLGQYVSSRRQDPAIQAAMTTLSDPDGGFLSVPTLETGIRNISQNISPFRALATVITIGTGTYEVIVDPTLATVTWADETQARPDTATPGLIKISIPVGELYAKPKCSQTLLDDSSVDLGAWLTNNVSIGMSQKEGTAFVAGDGIAGKPFGILSVAAESGDDFARSKFNTLQYVPTGATSPTSVQLADAIIALNQKLRAPYRPNAVWMMSRDFGRVIRQLKDSNNLYLWSNDFGRVAAGQPELLLGSPVYFNEDMPAAGANAFPLAYGDLRAAYTIVDRIGLRVLRDPFSSQPYVAFYVTKRVGGNVVDYNALKLLKYSAT